MAGPIGLRPIVVGIALLIVLGVVAYFALQPDPFAPQGPCPHGVERVTDTGALGCRF